MKVTSRIKKIFSDELLRYIAAICDTKRIPSNNRKMIMLGNLLYTYGVEFEILGGATNRIAVQIDGYAIKIAMDEQGYKDNLVEYGICHDLYPDVSKSYETNGYIQVQELGEIMTPEEFKSRRSEIMNILNNHCQDFLLGDVGYLPKNRTNWAIRRNPDGTSNAIMIDYAYCHRATENLFTCENCGAPLTWDSYFDKLLCTDRSGCRSTFTYNQRKSLQGEQVDLDMIAEAKKLSIKLGKGETSKEIDTFEDRLISDDYFVIDSFQDAREYQKLVRDIMNNKEGDEDMYYDEMDNFDLLVELATNPNTDIKKKLEEQLGENAPNIPEPIYTENYQDEYQRSLNFYVREDIMEYFEEYPRSGFDDEEEYDEYGLPYYEEDDDYEFDFDSLIDLVTSKPKPTKESNKPNPRKEQSTVNNKPSVELQSGFNDLMDLVLSSQPVNGKEEKSEIIIESKESINPLSEVLKKYSDNIKNIIIDKEDSSTDDESEEEIILTNDFTLGTVVNESIDKNIIDVEATIANVDDMDLSELSSHEVILNGKPLELGMEVVL